MKKNEIIPSSKDIIKEAEEINSNFDINQIHSKTFELIKKHREIYYKKRIEELLSNLDMPEDVKSKIKKALLKPIEVGDKIYSNFMEEVSRRVSQTFQVISGNIAELCVERELIKVGLKLGVHYVKKAERTDFIIYFPQKENFKKKHRIEVKNVKLRERGTRGLAFDGDTMMGFFNQPSEFTVSNIEVIDEHCKKTKGYCYVPPETLKLIKHKNSRFKSNIELALDMKKFVETGSI